MKVDKRFAVLVLGGGMMAGCGGQPATMPAPPSEDAPADEAPAEDAPADEAPAATDGEAGKCAWF